MNIYLVQEFSRADYDFSTDIKNHGLYINRNEAIVRARQIFEKLKEEYAKEIDQYTYKEDNDDYFDEDGEVEFDIDEEKGWFEFTFGSEEDFELLRVTVEEIDFENEAYVVHRKCKRVLLTDDIQNKAFEMDIELEDKNIEQIALKVERALDNNEVLWESYWLTIESVLEDN